MTYTFPITNGGRSKIHALDVTDAPSLASAISTALAWLRGYREKVNPRAAVNVEYAGESWQVLRRDGQWVLLERPGMYPNEFWSQWVTVGVLTP